MRSQSLCCPCPFPRYSFISGTLRMSHRVVKKSHHPQCIHIQKNIYTRAYTEHTTHSYTHSYNMPAHIFLYTYTHTHTHNIHSHSFRLLDKKKEKKIKEKSQKKNIC